MISLPDRCMITGIVFRQHSVRICYEDAGGRKQLNLWG